MKQSSKVKNGKEDKQCSPLTLDELAALLRDDLKKVERAQLLSRLYHDEAGTSIIELALSSSPANVSMQNSLPPEKVVSIVKNALESSSPAEGINHRSGLSIKHGSRWVIATLISLGLLVTAWISINLSVKKDADALRIDFDPEPIWATTLVPPGVHMSSKNLITGRISAPVSLIVNWRFVITNNSHDAVTLDNYILAAIPEALLDSGIMSEGLFDVSNAEQRLDLSSIRLEEGAQYHCILRFQVPMNQEGFTYMLWKFPDREAEIKRIFKEASADDALLGDNRIFNAYNHACIITILTKRGGRGSAKFSLFSNRQLKPSTSPTS